MMTQKVRYVLLLLSLTLYSCNICSHSSKDMSVEEEQYYCERIADNSTALSSVGYPVIPDTISSEIIVRTCYTVSYNKTTLQPNWVMWHLTGNHVMKRKEGIWNDYREDSEIEEEFRATLADYASSGYDRGHMCPGGDCNWNVKGRDETYLLSNMCPQNPNLNRGDWKEIEIACRKWAQKYESVYIVCGPIFFKSQEHVRIGPNMIPVPEAFFKVVVCLDELSPKGIGFICRNTDGNRKKDFYVNTIRQVERVTGYKFFTKLNDSIISKIFDLSDINSW